jgi:branched-chain amino acid transport system permease protein
METTTIPPSAPPAARARPLAAVRRFAGRWGLIAALAALPVYYGIHDLTVGYQAGVVAGHAVIRHDLSNLGFNFAVGLSNGAIWALIAIGLTSATGGAWLIVGLLIILIITMLVTGSLNVLIERVAYRPLRNAPKLAPLITAVGFSFILQNVGLLWRGGSPQSVPDLINVQQTVFTIAGVPIQRGYILAFAVMIPLVFALGWFINSTHAGRAMRATAQDPEAARLMGINVNATISLTFLLGGMLAGAAGLVYALYQTNVWFFQGFKAGLIAFTAAVMGGIGNVRGAVLGGLIIGVIQALADSRLGPQWTEAVVFGYLIAIMVLRPRGLLGEETREAG